MLEQNILWDKWHSCHKTNNIKAFKFYENAAINKRWKSASPATCLEHRWQCWAL